MSQALSICKEFFKVQCSDFTSEEKTSADQTPDRHPICMVSPAQQRGQCFYSVSDFKKVSEFFRSHKTLLLCPFMGFYRYGNSADTFIDFRLALRFVWTVCTLFLLKGNMKLLGFITPFSVVVLGNFRRFLLVIFLFLFLHLDFSFIYNKFSMPFWDFFY